jgi:hypothetical protein
MWEFQKPLQQAKPGDKWLLMERIFKLESQALSELRKQEDCCS